MENYLDDEKLFDVQKINNKEGESQFTADRIAQMVEHRTLMRDGHGFVPWPDQHSGS